MSATHAAPNPSVAVPAANGEAQKPARKPREVPTIAINASKAEYNEVKAAVDKMLSPELALLGISVNVGPFVLAHALRSIRNPSLGVSKGATTEQAKK